MSAPAAHPDSRLAGLWSRHRLDLLAIGALAAICAAYALWIVLGDRTYFAGPDNADQAYAWSQKLAAVLHHGRLPIWDKNTEAGRLFPGEGQTATFYPVQDLWLLVFGSARGISTRWLEALVLLHAFIASVGFYCLTRTFAIDRRIAVGAAVTFAYGGAFASRAGGQTVIYFGMAWIPWAVCFAKRHLDGKSAWNAVAAGAVLGLSVLAGHLQALACGLLVIGCFYGLTQPLASRVVRERAKGLALLIGASGLVAAPQLAILIPYLNRAYRFVGTPEPLPPGGHLDYATFVKGYAGGPENVTSFIDPRFTVTDGNTMFIGLAALVLVVFATFVARSRLREVAGPSLAPLAASGALAALLFIGPWTFLPRIFYSLPLFGDIRELARYAIVVELVVCLLLALSLQALLDARARGEAVVTPAGRRLALIAGGLLALNGLYVAHRGYGLPRHTGLQLILAGAAVATTAAGVTTATRRGLSLGTLAAVVLIAGALTDGDWSLGRQSSSYHPPRYFARNATIGFLERECVGHRTFVLNDALPRNIADVYRDIQTYGGYSATLHETYRRLTSANYDPLGPQSAMLDVGCLVEKQPGQAVPPPWRKGFVDTETGLVTYVNPRASRINSPTGVPIPARVLIDRDQHRRYEVTLRAPATVVVGDIRYPGWTLEVDGRRESSSYEVGGVGVLPQAQLSAGTHRLDYRFSKAPFTWGL